MGSNKNQGYLETFLGFWTAGSLIVYALMFAAAAVVYLNQHNPRVRTVWFVFSVLALVAIAFNVPDASRGRWGGTAELIVIFYLLIVTVPAIICVGYGLGTRPSSDGS